MATTLDDMEIRFAQAAIRRGILDPAALEKALARVRGLREKGKTLRLEDAVREGGAPLEEVRAIREALRPSRGRPAVPGHRLLEEIGRGAVGTVYRAKQTALDRVVALKVLPKVLVESRREVDRFLREARLAATLAHPGVVKVYEVGETEDRYFISMEFVPGESLAARVARQGVLPPGRALAMARDAAAALAHAHARGVIHRDLKPANVMLAADGAVKIVDLGLARGTAAVPSDRITEIGVLVGTPEFMAPEQARDPGAVDGRADVWALGATLYFALAGRPPFEGRNALDVLARL
ncbi:MAG: serine/threonine protein kinase, partial [Planctomycetes bacterium]|nr:serine/threonine protein kinase [Planctomycetota bacterium]